MKTKSVSPSALHTPRSINGVACRSLVVLLALLALIAFASSSALATQADPVDFSESGASPSTIYVYATTVTSGATIFATMGNYFIPADPTHNGGTPTGSTFICGGTFAVFYGQHKWIKALAWRSDLTDSAINIYEVDNSGN